MDKLTTEQKAERYVQALDRAKKWYNAPNIDKIPTYGNRIIEEIFPELTESEDERIRKGIVKYLEQSQFGEEYYCIDDDIVRDYIDWLEKQGELVNSLSKGLDNAHERIDRLIQKNNELCIKLEKQGEQNLIMAKSPQLGEQKPAWSEKDEEMFMSLYSPNFTKEQRDWLKSLKDRIGCELNCTTMWKPSDEQMEALEQFISEYKDIDDNFRAYPISHNIESLYNDLKKLTE